MEKETEVKDLTKEELATLGLLLRRYRNESSLTGNERINSILKQIAIELYVNE